MERTIQLPSKELPQDIQELPREDTICQFCGVSYLVHHEVKRLEERVAHYQQEVKRLLLAETTLSALDAKYKELEKKYNAKCDELNNARQKQFETMDHLHSLLASVRLVHVDRKEVLHLLSSTLSSIKDSQSVVMKAVSSHICRNCGKYYEEIRKLQLNLAEREQFYQNQCGQQEKVEAMLRGDLDRWKKETLYYKTKLNGLEDQLAETEVQVQHYRVEMESLTEQLRKMKWNLMDLEETVAKKNTALQSLESIYNENEAQLSATKAKLQKVEIIWQSEKKSLEASYEAVQEDLASVRGELTAMEKKHQLQMKKQQKECDTAVKKCEMESLLLKEELQKTRKQFQVQVGKMKSTLAISDLEHQKTMHNLQEELVKEKSIFEREMCKHIDQVKQLQLKLISEQEMKREAAKLTNSLDDCKQLVEVKEAHCKYLEKLLDEAFKEISLLQNTIQKQCEEREELRVTMTKAQT